MNIPILKCSKEFKTLICKLIKADILFDIEYKEDNNSKIINIIFSRKLQDKEECLYVKFESNLKHEYFEYFYNNDCEYKIIDTDIKSIKQWMNCEDYFTLKKYKKQNNKDFQ